MPKEVTFEEALGRARRMSERYVEKGPYEFFPLADIVDEVQRGLAKNLVNHGRLYCPWMTLSGDPDEDRKKICPCERHHEDISRDGFCIWMFFVSEEYLRQYQQTGDVGASTLGEVTPLGESLFPAEKDAEHLPKSKRGPKRANAWLPDDQRRWMRGLRTMRRNLRPENLGDLLMQPRVAILATRGRDDNTLLSAVWQEWTDGGFTVVTFIGDVKLRHVQQEPAASIIVAEDAPPYRGIEVRAEARVVSGDADAALRRLAGRYLGPDKVDAYMEKIGPALLALIRMEPWQTAGLGLRGRSMVKAFSSRPWRYAETALRGRPLYCF